MPTEKAQARAVGGTYRHGQTHGVGVVEHFVEHFVTGSFNERMGNQAILASL